VFDKFTRDRFCILSRYSVTEQDVGRLRGCSLTKPPQIRSTRTVAKSRLFEIEEVELHFSNGHQARYERLGGNASGVLVVPVTEDGMMLLIREYAVGFERYELGFVKGRVEIEESPQFAAAREMREEIGFDAGEFRLLASVSLTPAYSSYRTFIFLAMGLHESPLVGDEPEELETVTWPLSDLEQLRRRDDFTDARCLLATYLVDQALVHEDG
jgi:ADP-ribose diphosphatase